MTASRLLEIDSLTAGYGATHILHRVSMSVTRGQVAAVIGPNGAGKTTLARAVSGFAHRFEGRIRFDDDDVSDWPPERRTRRGIGAVPEGRRLFPALTVTDNLELALFEQGRRRSGVTRRELLDPIVEMFPVLRERPNQRAGSLSGGQQQMVAIARALLLQPSLLVLDEPSTGLAPVIVERIFERIAQISRDFDCSCLLIEQRAATALTIADYAYVLDRGEIQFAGPAIEMERDARLQDVYLGGRVHKK